MAQSFTLGIRHLWDELLLMQAPGLYWLNADRRQDAVLLCRQVIGSQPADTRAALICAGGAPAEVVDELEYGGPQKLPLFSLPESGPALAHLSEDLMRGLKPRGRLLLLLAPARLWQALDPGALWDWVAQMSRWLCRQGCTLLIVGHGPGGNALHASLSSRHRTLQGLSRLRWLQDKHQYQVAFWCNHDGVSAGQQLALLPGERGWQLWEDEPQPSRLRHDEHQVLAERHVLEGAPALSEHWRLFDSNRALAEAGRQAQAATLVFALRHSEQVEELARQIHQLRRLRGKGIKLVVRELSVSLRHTDEHLLLACGANLIASHHVPLSRVPSLLEAVQGQSFGRHVPSDIGELFAATRPLRLKGVLGQASFCRALISLMSHPLLPEDDKGVLVALQPVSGLRAGQALTLCRMHRDGDLAMTVDNHLFVFLFACRVNEVDVALGHIFRLSVSGLFGRRRVWHQDRHILDQVRLLQAQQPTGWSPAEPPRSAGQKIQPSAPPVPRPLPQGIRLPVFREEDE
ncbi:cellulose biosynthesis protein BcsE [Zobellella maritima]|uniref:cellulose biosynthesis protein BcsE n=1 Tax=Zobellella maritima TaxID=2059725 RepID=UPI000E3057DF|nr:cellulose biosynthesis protein BcsE [Zobellella maritima]